MRLIIVEDEEMFAKNLTQLLEMKGFAVDWLNTAEKAHARILLYQNEYDLIILDLNLPGISGMGLTKQLRQEGVTTPIIILTGNSDTENKMHFSIVALTITSSNHFLSTNCLHVLIQY